MAITEIISDPTRRVFWLANCGIDTKLTPLDGTNTSIFIRPGAVSINGGPAINWAGGYVIPLNPFYAGRVPSGTLAFSFIPNGTHQLYVDTTTGNITMAVSSPGASFPAGSLPLYVITTDGVIRFRNLQDVRPSTAGMQGTMEAVSNSAYRGSYGNSFSLSEVTAQNSGAYVVQIGTGAVTIDGTTFTPTGGGWFNLTATSSAGAGSVCSETAYQGGSTVQMFINPNGQLQTELVEYPLGVLLSGLTSVTQFPAGSLPLLVAHLGCLRKDHNPG